MQDIAALTAEREQLIARIAEIDKLLAASVQAIEGIYTVTEIVSASGTIYAVVPTDGAEDSRAASYRSRDLAELHAEFCERTPAHYRISLKTPPARGMRSTKFWQIEGSRKGDPKSLKSQLNVDHQVAGNWPEGTRVVDLLVHFALQHEAGVDARIAAKAEADAIAAAEATVRDARAAQLAQVQKEKGPLATPRQVEYILSLLEQRRISGDGGGFFYGPTDRAGIEMLSKDEASSYITSLKGDY